MVTLVGIRGHTYVVIRIVHQLGDIDVKLGGSVAARHVQCTDPNVDICTVACSVTKSHVVTIPSSQHIIVSYFYLIPLVCALTVEYIKCLSGYSYGS